MIDIESLSSLVCGLLDFFVPGYYAPERRRRCPTCKSRLLSETGRRYTHREPVGLEGAEIMVHYREYRCTGCGDHCHIRAD